MNESQCKEKGGKIFFVSQKSQCLVVSAQLFEYNSVSEGIEVRDCDSQFTGV